MINLLNILNLFNKKSKKKFLNKIFEFIQIILLSKNLLNYQNNNNIKFKQYKIIYKLIENILIENNGKIKLEKKTFELVEKYNNIMDFLIRKEKFLEPDLETNNSDDEFDNDE